MPSEPIPAALEQLRPYLEKETLPWAEVSAGDSIIVTSCDAEGNALGDSAFTLLDMEKQEDGTYRTVLRLESSEVTFGDDSSPRKPVELPAGTIMSGGVGCEHFPETTTYMMYVGGISTGRDFSFDNVLTPDGEVRQDAALRDVTQVAHRDGDLEESAEETVTRYQRTVEEEKKKDDEDTAQQMQAIEGQLDKELQEHLDEKTGARIKDLWSTFSDEGKWRLAILWSHALDQEVTERYLPALEEAMEEEFTWAPNAVRGAMMLPASQRGYAMMVEKLGLQRKES
ncbi:MAG: hypothetical protein Q8Q11_00880 [bacterium]|nr:hypothetical protein [bacterium]